MDATGSLCVARRDADAEARRPTGARRDTTTPGGDARYMYQFFYEVVFKI
jgi:hypothetical protein